MAAPWVLLCRFAAVGPDNGEGQEPTPDFSIELRAPPRVSFLTAARRVHPNPGYIEPDPYLLAAGPSGALFRFATAPSTGPSPDRALVVAHHFRPAEGGQQLAATSTATAERIPRSAVSMVMPERYVLAGTVGLVSSPEGDRYVIPELRFWFGGASDRAKLLLFFAGHDQWLDVDLFIPLEAQGRPFVSADVLNHDGDNLWWVDLSWGLLSCSPVANEPNLLFHPLPPGRSVDSYNTNLHDERCVCESNHKLRFVEIIRGPLDSAGRVTASVSMWTRIPEPDGSGRTARWDKDYEVSFDKIWNHDSYNATQLPKEIPAIVLVSPVDPELVYFFLKEEKRLVGINVCEHKVKVVEFITEQLPGYREPPTVPASRIRVLPWILPRTISDGNCILAIAILCYCYYLMLANFFFELCGCALQLRHIVADCVMVVCLGSDMLIDPL
jgi:hypothetical protein